MSDRGHYLIDSPELCDKFTIAHALTLDSLRNAHGKGGEGEGGGGDKTTCRFYYNDGIMSLGLL